MRARVYIIAASFAVPACLFYLLMGFITDIQSYGATAAGADAIVVLTGGKGRAEAGISLLRRGAADTLIVSGVHRDADIDSIFINDDLSERERERIVLEKNSDSTYTNALEVKELVVKMDIESVILITSGYHMKRAERTFRRVLPAELKITPYAVSSPNFDSRRWWRGTSLGIAFVEFIKYYWYEIRFAIGS